MSEDMNSDYGTSSIKVLHGLEAVRKRPGMYIGDTDDGSGLHHMVFEAVDNSIDEALAGFCNHIEVTIHEDDSVSCRDNGRGIPVAIHPEEKVSAAEVVMTVLHAGGKFDSNSYKVSGGLHGVGISVVNALSDKLELTIRREGHIWQQVYLNGGNPEAPLHIIGDLKEGDETGTTVRFWPSPSIFTKTVFEYNILAKRLRELSFLNSGIKITLSDLREDPVKQEVFYHEGGIGEFIQFLNKGKTPLNNKIIHFVKNCEDNITVEVGMQWTDAYNESIYCFTNNVPQKDGGTHAAGFKRALTSTFSSFLESSGITKKSKITPNGDDARYGLTAVISVKMPDPKFSSQTKDKLVSSEATGAVSSSVGEALDSFLIENPKDAEAICSKIIDAAREREAVRKARDLSRGKKSDIVSKAEKLVACRTKDPEIAEIFLVEGDSAGGSAKGGRDSFYQAVLPLRGKILNVQKASTEKILRSEQIGTLVSVFGCGIGEEYDPSKFRYHNVIIMTDADVDGAHIRILLLTFFNRFMRDLIENGYVYVAEPPLYKYTKGKTERYIITDEEALDYKNKLAVKCGTLFPSRSDEAIPENQLFRLFNEFSNGKKKIENPKFKMDKSISYALINHPLLTDEDIKSESKVKEWTEAFVKLLPCNLLEGLFYKGETEYDPVSEAYYPIIVNHVHGIDYKFRLDEHFRKSASYNLLIKLNNMTNSLVKEDGYIVFGTREVPVSNFPQAYDIMLKEGFSGFKVQRYKGLGEMSPEQLSETTMNKDTRHIRQVTMDDAIQADTLFENLMGDDVDERKIFIENHFDMVDGDI